ncbi:TIGR02206 family membrane protein [Bacillus sp. ISL-47]|uniref:YwaF family protein n=1 Tax=Bacillus sp. ISL-47 TaxID=2819130 RepID=UPI001BEC0480|nr:TIGR02206 family membrane protein [Bacillus sp. ISL-47]MBT2686698.1 TIGR02206 family membrane protein [Bacillus sp. ISL-47]MBT2710418.1 TIGR02206 family membrane protein [Pseudomonas sp. ISL-84]
MEWFGLSKKPFNFDLFSVSHFVILAIFILGITAIFLCRTKLSNEKCRRAEIGAAFSLIVIEILNHAWMYTNGVWKPGRSLPLELCNIALILCIFLLVTRKKIYFELIFFIALLGATQAIITPALTYGFPHFRFIHFFYAHLMVVWVTLYFTWAKGYYPTFRSFMKLIVFINLLLPLVLFVNKRAEGNYWFLRHKPKSPSLFDVLGPYPWYIFSLEGVLIVISLIAWLILRKMEKSSDERSHAK